MSQTPGFPIDFLVIVTIVLRLWYHAVLFVSLQTSTIPAALTAHMIQQAIYYDHSNMW